MVRTCVVGKCNTNYKSEIKSRKKSVKIPVYKFPKDASRQLWIDALPNVLRKKVTDHVGICELHWPEGFERIKVRGGHEKPKNLPSVFALPDSCRRQTTAIVQRSPDRRRISLEEGNAATQQKIAEKDLIKNWTTIVEVS